mgnify:FL=1
MDLTRILRDQRQELDYSLKKKKIIEREAEEIFKNFLNSKLIKIISGIRRSGKSVFIYLLLKDKKFAYMNFDDERIINVNTDDILSSFYEIYWKDIENIFLDEIQNLDNWQLFVNRLHRSGFNIFITGSNSKLLSKELATHLTGRHLTMELFPFSFREYLRAMEFRENKDTTKGESLLKSELKKYLEIGGFPEIVVERENPGNYLRELYSKIVERDIISRYKISFKKTFKEISSTLINNPSKLISYNKIKNNFGLGSEHTAKNYISYLEESYLIFILNRFSFKPVEIEKSEKKIYVIDTGLINNMSFKLSDNYGSIYENAVAIELMRLKSFNKNMEIYYWKNILHEEVDFAIKEKSRVKELIQVCYDLNNFDTKERELRSLIKASDELKCDNLFIITGNYKKEEKIKNKIINYIPLYEWLLKSR